MEIIVTRSRIAGTLPFYAYRALISAEAVNEARRRQACIVKAPRIAGCAPGLRIAPIIAPARYFELKASERQVLGSHIDALARRIETLIVRIIFPEMTADLLRPVITLDHDPGDGCIWTDIDDLAGAYDRLASDHDILTAFDLGLRRDFERRVA